MHLAASVGNLQVLVELLESGADLRSRGWLGNTALHCAAESAQTEIMKELLSRGMELDLVNSKGEHPIHLAAGVAGKTNSIDHIEFLLQKGANIKKAR